MEVEQNKEGVTQHVETVESVKPAEPVAVPEAGPKPVAAEYVGKQSPSETNGGASNPESAVHPTAPDGPLLIPTTKGPIPYEDLMPKNIEHPENAPVGLPVPPDANGVVNVPASEK